MPKQTIAEKIKQRRLQILVHSCIYYSLDQNIISDAQWNAWSEELKQLQSDYPEISKTVDWYDDFEDWDGSTGAFLPIDNEWVVNKANQLLQYKESRSAVKSLKPKKPVQTKSVALF